MKRVLVWLIALNVCGVVAVVGHCLIAFGPVPETAVYGGLLAAPPFVVALLLSLPLFRSVRSLGRTFRQSLRTTLLCVVPAAVGIPSVGAIWFFVEDQVITGWLFLVLIHLGYAGALVLCASTVHHSSGLFSNQVSNRFDPMLTWTEGIVIGLCVTWLPTFLCFFGSLWIFPVLYPVVVLASGVHFALLYRAVGNMETVPEPSGQVEP